MFRSVTRSSSDWLGKNMPFVLSQYKASPAEEPQAQEVCLEDHQAVNGNLKTPPILLMPLTNINLIC